MLKKESYFVVCVQEGNRDNIYPVTLNQEENERGSTNIPSSAGYAPKKKETYDTLELASARLVVIKAARNHSLTTLLEMHRDGRYPWAYGMYEQLTRNQYQVAKQTIELV